MLHQNPNVLPAALLLNEFAALKRFAAVGIGGVIREGLVCVRTLHELEVCRA